MYYFLKKLYLNFTYEKKNNFLIISYIPYLDLNLEKFFSNSFYIPFRSTIKKNFHAQLNHLLKKINVDKIFIITADSEYLILLNFLNSKKYKNNFDYKNANWGFSYYLKSILNRDKILPNKYKLLDYPDLNYRTIKIDFNNKQLFVDKIYELTKIKKYQVIKQLNLCNKDILNKYITSNQIKLIKMQYDVS